MRNSRWSSGRMRWCHGIPYRTWLRLSVLHHEDGLKREKQLLIDFLCSSAGGPMYYTGRDMKVSHKGMKINETDWTAFMGHVNATMDAFKVPKTERGEVVAFVQSLKRDIVEA